MSQAVLSSQAWRLALESTSDGVLLLDRDWRILFANVAAARLVQREIATFVDKTLWEQFPEAVGTRSERTYRHVLDTGEPATFVTYSAALKGWLEVRVFANENGLTIFFRDVSFRRVLDEERREVQRFTRSVLDSVPTWVLVLDSDGGIRLSNQSWTSYRAEVQGQPAAEGLESDYFELCLRAARLGDVDAQLILTGLKDVTARRSQQFRHDYPCPSPTGVRWFELEARPLMGRSGIVVTHTEVTSRVDFRGKASPVRLAGPSDGSPQPDHDL